MDLQFYQWKINWFLPIIFPGYVFFSSPFSPTNTSMLESPAVLRYLILLDLRLHAWVILRSETFIAWSPTSLLSEKWFLHKNQTARKCVQAQNLDTWQNVPVFSGSSIACISPSGYLMPQKNFGGCSRKLHCFSCLILPREPRLSKFVDLFWKHYVLTSAPAKHRVSSKNTVFLV